MRKFFFIIILLLSLFTGTYIGFADIIEKKPYSIPAETKYKTDLNIAVLPLSGELSEERKYIKSLIKNHIADNILQYKTIYYSPSLIEFKKTAFSSKKKLENNISYEDNKANEKIDAGRFLTLKLVEDNKLVQLKTNSNIESQEWYNYPGIDIIISGAVVQDKQNLKVILKVFNNFILKKVSIDKEASFKNIDQLLKTLSQEVIMAVIDRYSFLNITSNEKNARIYIDDRFFGRTDKSGILLEAGNHNVVVIKENYIAKKIQLNLEEKAIKTINIDFSQADPIPRNTIQITSIPEKAKVYLDSNYIGLTPVVKNDLNNGKYRLRVEKDGFITNYQTVEFDKDKDKIKNVSLNLEKGDSNERYFSRTTAYNTLFKSSFFGIAFTSASYIFFGLKVDDERAKLRSLSTSDPNYESKKDKIQKRKDNYYLYQQISLYTLGAIIISAGIFYYLDKAQDDIAIALYMPQQGLTNSSSGSLSINSSSFYKSNQIEKNICIIITKSF